MKIGDRVRVLDTSNVDSREVGLKGTLYLGPFVGDVNMWVVSLDYDPFEKIEDIIVGGVPFYETDLEVIDEAK